MRRASLLLPLIALSALSCTPLQDLKKNTCGNGVVEPANEEDCEPVEGSDFYCRPPGDPLECTIRCNADGECPTGFGCGTDDVCRKGGGTFERVAFLQAGSQANELLTGDFDADRRKDVVAVEPGRARIYFTDASGNVEQATVTSPLPPAIGRLGSLDPDDKTATLDTTDDLLLPLSIGIGALLSEGNRSFKSKAYGSVPLDTLPLEVDGIGTVLLDIVDAVPMAIDAVPSAFAPFSGDEPLAMLTLRYENPLTGKTVEATIVADFGPTEGGLILPLEATRTAALSGPPVRGNFDDDPCEELVLPRSGSSHVRVYKMCSENPIVQGTYSFANWRSERSAVVDDIRVDGVISGPAFAADVDGDGLLDLAITVTRGGQRELQVAYGTGGGQFHSSPSLPPGETPDDRAGRYATLPSGSPLALVRLDGDGLVDMVDTGGVARGGTTLSMDGKPEMAFLPWAPASRPWTDAVVADINGDGDLDVLASSDGATDVDVLLGTPAGFWNKSQIATDGTVSQLVAGDFDGDLVQDIVFDDIVSSSESLLLISYGRTSGGPEEPSEVGSFGAVESLISGNVHSFGSDSISELGAISRTEGQRAFSFFPGTATRLLQAPLLLNDDQQKTHLPLAAGSGFLPQVGGADQVAGRRDLVVLSVHPDPDVDVRKDDPLVVYKRLAASLRVWGLYGGESEADFSRLNKSICAIPSGFYFPRLEPAHSIAVSASDAGSAGLVVVAAPHMTFAGAETTDVQISSIIGKVSFAQAEQCWSEDSKFEQYVVSDAGEMFFRVRTADLNANGIPEILAVKRTYDPYELKYFLDSSLSEVFSSMPGGGPMGPSPLTQLRSELVVFWDADVLNSYPIPEGLSDVRDFTAGEIDGDGDPDLLILDGPLVRRFEGKNGTRELHAQADITDFAVPEGGAQAILLADVDGDGIQDVAVRGESLQVFRGQGPAVVESDGE